MKTKPLSWSVLAAALLATPLMAQGGPSAGGATPEASAAVGVRDAFLGHFQQSSYKISELARVMPADKYSWAPGEGVMEVAEVYMHLARYNFMYLDENLGIAPPDGFDYSDIESLRDKDKVQEIFARSVQHVQDNIAAMSQAELEAETGLYGRTVEGWAVLMQLIAHMNEHVGQSVAYARMNGIAPPWSR